MSAPAISVERLGKRYRIGRAQATTSGPQSLLQGLAAPFRGVIESLKAPGADEILWALKDMTFEVGQGEVVGLVGSNGAGKSTLLKMLSQITEPTEGRAVINGRVGSLLEVGAGFHPELTGRENIYLSGAIMGMRKSEIDRKFDEIVGFAEVEKFLDTPVKRYSSGMYVRLAFAVASQLEAEVLLVDEVLAVGDMAFQRKCLGKMGDVASAGRTVLFVSHNMVAVQNLCHRALWLDQGRLLEDGPAAEVVARYLATSSQTRTEELWSDPLSAPGNDKVRLRRVCIRPRHGAPTDPISLSTPLTVEVDYWNLAPGARLHISLHVLNERQIVVFTTNSNETDAVTSGHPLPAGSFRSECQIPAHFLNSGVHRILVLVRINGRTIILRHENAVIFEVLELEGRPGAGYGKDPGAVRPKLAWKTVALDEDAAQPVGSGASDQRVG